MQDLRVQQANQEVEMIPANNAHTITDEHFAEYRNYEIKSHNSHCYHVLMEKRRFNSANGRKESKAQVTIYTVEMFRMATKMKPDAFVGYTTHILHDPEKAGDVIKGRVLTLDERNAKQGDDDGEDQNKSTKAPQTGGAAAPLDQQGSGTPGSEFGPEGSGAPETEETDLSVEAINAITDVAKMKKIYREVVGEEPTKSWGLEKTRAELLSYLGL